MFYLCLSYLLDQRSLILKLVLVGVSYPYRTYRFSFPTGLWKATARVLVFMFSPIVINIFIVFKAFPQIYCDWRQVNHLKVFLLIFVKCIFGSGRGIDLLLFFFGDGLRDRIACSLLGGGILSHNSSYKITRLCPSLC